MSRYVGSQKLDWVLAPGDAIKRTDLHDLYGGTRQGGISASTTTPTVLLFTVAGHAIAERKSANWSHSNHGYRDRWEDSEKRVYLYCGMGQDGDQDPLWSGNRAILHHHSEGRDIRLFTPNSGTVKYVGRFFIDLKKPYLVDRAPDRLGVERSVIQFRLHPYGEIADWFRG
jgi:5-methylcytosine-specific restriction protein A